MVLAVVAAGGVLGSLARFGLASAFPGAVTTVVVNVVGCLLIGVLMEALARHHPRQRFTRPFLGAGVLGGFTTFSAAMTDAQALAQDGRAALAALLLGGTAVAAVAATAAGVWLVRR
ncbi:fluoride efflux transporter FluC [Actinokineospora sp. 24-640]